MDKMSIELLKLGVRFSPPTLVLLYKNEKARTRQRSMPIRDLTKESDCYNLAARLKKRHEKYIGSLQTVRIEKFLRLLQETMRGRTLDEALKAIDVEFRIDFSEDMNRLSDRDLQRRKELMDINFEKNRVKVGDPDFVYDKQVVLDLSNIP